MNNSIRFVTKCATALVARNASRQLATSSMLFYRSYGSSSTSTPTSSTTTPHTFQIEAINPHDAQLIKRFDLQSDVDVENMIANSEKTFHEYKRLSVPQRAHLLRNLADVLEANKVEYGRLMTQEMGKTHASAIAEVEKCAGCCRYYADEGPRFLSDEIVQNDATVHSRIVYQPLGPIIQFAPFNFPFWQVIRFIAPALMAGNTALIRHAHSVPQSALALKDAMNKAGYDDGVLQILFVNHEQAFEVIRDKRIKGVTVTGSTRVGSLVAAEAGKHLKKSVLELGGSDPFIVLKDADIDEAVKVAVGSRTLNNGQSCIAAKRFIIEKSVAKEFTDKLVEKMSKLKVGNPMEKDTDVGPLARADLRDQVHSQVLKTVSQGGHLLLGGQIPSDKAGYYYPPTVIANVKPGMVAFNDEIFGPVAGIIIAENEEHAVTLANDSDYGLGGSVWTRDVAKGERIARELECGMAFVNQLVRSAANLPFGGVKASGYGRECSAAGIHEWTNMKALLVK